MLNSSFDRRAVGEDARDAAVVLVAQDDGRQRLGAVVRRGVERADLAVLAAGVVDADGAPVATGTRRPARRLWRSVEPAGLGDGLGDSPGRGTALRRARVDADRAWRRSRRSHDEAATSEVDRDRGAGSDQHDLARDRRGLAIEVVVSSAAVGRSGQDQCVAPPGPGRWCRWSRRAPHPPARPSPAKRRARQALVEPAGMAEVPLLEFAAVKPHFFISHRPLGSGLVVGDPVRRGPYTSVRTCSVCMICERSRASARMRALTA